MRAVINKNLVKAAFITLVLAVSTTAGFGYPPDNAAVLYYKAFLLYKPEKEMERALHDLAKDTITLDENIKKHVAKNRNIVNFAIDASEAKFCDWGIDYSEGMYVLIPHLNKMRYLARLVIGDAKILAEQNDHQVALSRCICVHQMAGHVANGILINYLVSIALDDLANNCTLDILAAMPRELETLKWVRNQLMDVEIARPSLKAAVSIDAKSLAVDMRIEKTEEILKVLSDNYIASSAPNGVKNRIENADEQFFERNRTYWENHAASVIAALDLPYAQAYPELKALDDKPKKHALANPDATLTAIFLPALTRVYGQAVAVRNFSNAIKAAVEIYIIVARTSRLPDALPAGLPKDLFSGEDFEYEKTSDGFVLRCRAKDLLKDKIHEYEFKVKN